MGAGAGWTRAVLLAVALGAAGATPAAETVLQNDSVADGSNAAIVWGFTGGEKAASWLTSSCDGELVAVQVFWRSPGGITPASIQDSLQIHRAGSFPEPGALETEVLGPVLTDGVINEWRYVDENNTIPISVPVSSNETLVVAFGFAEEPEPGFDPSVVRDTDGITPGRNAIYAHLAGVVYHWMDAASLGVAGDWVIRAVVDCAAVASEADISVTLGADLPAYVAGAPLRYTATVSNPGPATAGSVTLVDIFPPAFRNPTWICAPTGGATCPLGGSGQITGTASLPAGSALEFNIDGDVAPGTTGTLGNSFTAVVNAPPTDPDPGNNTATLHLEAAADDDDLIFADGFDTAAGMRVPPAVHPARSVGHR